MKTENLIKELSQNLRPVKRISHPVISLIFWIGLSFITIFTFIWWRSENFQWIHLPKFSYELIPIFLFFFSSALIAIWMSIPGFRLNLNLSVFPVFLFVLWMSLLLLRASVFGKDSEALPYVYHNCLKDLILMSLPSSIYLVFLIRNRFPFSKSKIGFWIFAASASGSAIGEAFLCPNEDVSHLLLIHSVPVILFSLSGFFMGNLFFRDNQSLFFEKNTTM